MLFGVLDIKFTFAAAKTKRVQTCIESKDLKEEKGQFRDRSYERITRSIERPVLKKDREKVSNIFGSLKTLLTFAPRRNGTGITRGLVEAGSYGF